MDGAVIFFFVLAAGFVLFTAYALWSVSKEPSPTEDNNDLGVVARFQQKLIDINKVPHPKGKGTVWTPSE